MTTKEFVIQQICDVDRTACPRFLETRSEAELSEYYQYLANLERIKSFANTN